MICPICNKYTYLEDKCILDEQDICNNCFGEVLSKYAIMMYDLRKIGILRNNN